MDQKQSFPLSTITPRPIAAVASNQTFPSDSEPSHATDARHSLSVSRNTSSIVSANSVSACVCSTPQTADRALPQPRATAITIRKTHESYSLGPHPNFATIPANSPLGHPAEPIATGRSRSPNSIAHFPRRTIRKRNRNNLMQSIGRRCAVVAWLQMRQKSLRQHKCLPATRPG